MCRPDVNPGGDERLKVVLPKNTNRWTKTRYGYSRKRTTKDKRREDVRGEKTILKEKRREKYYKIKKDESDGGREQGRWERRDLSRSSKILTDFSKI